MLYFFFNAFLFCAGSASFVGPPLLSSFLYSYNMITFPCCLYCCMDEFGSLANTIPEHHDTHNILWKIKSHLIQPSVIMPENNLSFLARSTFPSVLHVGINVYLLHQSLHMNECICRREQTVWAPVNSTSWASNSSNRSTDSSDGSINLTHRTTEGTFLIAEPLARRGLLLPEPKRMTEMFVTLKDWSCQQVVYLKV